MGGAAVTDPGQTPPSAPAEDVRDVQHTTCCVVGGGPAGGLSAKEVNGYVLKTPKAN